MFYSTARWPVTLWSSVATSPSASGATIGGHVLIFGGHLHQYSPAPRNPPTVFSPIIFLPIILVICAIIGTLIVLARRMVRGPIAYPPLPRL